MLTQQQYLDVISGGGEAIGYEAVTVDDTVGGVSLTSATYNPTGGGAQTGHATWAFLTLETAQIRWTVDGTAPTTTVGHLLESGQNLSLVGENQIKKFRAIKTGGTSGALKVSYFRI